MHSYITYDVTIDPQKTRRSSYTPFSIYTFENSGSGQRGGLDDPHEYLLICSEFLYICYLHVC